MQRKKKKEEEAPNFKRRLPEKKRNYRQGSAKAYKSRKVASRFRKTIGGHSIRT